LSARVQNSGPNSIGRVVEDRLQYRTNSKSADNGHMTPTIVRHLPHHLASGAKFAATTHKAGCVEYSYPCLVESVL
jgi:hypothetical protein